MFTVVYETQDEVVAEEEFESCAYALHFAMAITSDGTALGDWAEVRGPEGTVRVVEGEIVEEEEEG